MGSGKPLALAFSKFSFDAAQSQSTNRLIKPLESGDLVAIRSVGAYGAVMSSTYNTRPLIPEVIVNDKEFAIVRPRPTYDEIIGLDQLPPWLSE